MSWGMDILGPVQAMQKMYHDEQMLPVEMEKSRATAAMQQAQAESQMRELVQAKREEELLKNFKFDSKAALSTVLGEAANHMMGAGNANLSLKYLEAARKAKATENQQAHWAATEQLNALKKTTSDMSLVMQYLGNARNPEQWQTAKTVLLQSGMQLPPHLLKAPFSEELRAQIAAASLKEVDRLRLQQREVEQNWREYEDGERLKLAHDAASRGWRALEIAAENFGLKVAGVAGTSPTVDDLMAATSYLRKGAVVKLSNGKEIDLSAMSDDDKKATIGKLASDARAIRAHMQDTISMQQAIEIAAQQMASDGLFEETGGVLSFFGRTARRAEKSAPLKSTEKPPPQTKPPSPNSGLPPGTRLGKQIEPGVFEVLDASGKVVAHARKK